MVTNRRPVQEFERGEAGFIEWVELNHSEDLENVIDKRMKINGHILQQAGEVIRFGLMCTDVSSGRQPSWDVITDLVSNVSFMPTLADDDHRRLSIHSKGDHRHSYH